MENATHPTEPTAAAGKRRDLHQEVTNTIIRQLEAGTVPWHRPWTNDDLPFSLPKNFATGNAYRGINILLLWSAATEHHYTCGEWASFKQWHSKKEAIRKGEKGTTIVYYDTFEKEVDGEIQKIPFLKSSLVFNRCQLASFNPKENVQEHHAYHWDDNIYLLEKFIQNTGAIIVTYGKRACYLPQEDSILIPAFDCFTSSPAYTATEAYYCTLLHELVHWSGHAKRLNRFQEAKNSNENYAIEELVAELGAAFLCGEFGIASTPHSGHADYIASWLKVLKNDKRFIFTAARLASKAVAYLHSLQPEG